MLITRLNTSNIVASGSRLSVVVPAFNESGHVSRILTRILNQSVVTEIIAVDDGSIDGTQHELQAYRIGVASLTIAVHPRNMGKGAAIRTGLSAATAPLVLIQDADQEYDPEDYPSLIDCLVQNNASVAYGSRFLNSEVVRDNPRWHTMGNRLLTWFANRITGQSLTDEATGYKLFRREVLERMNLQEDGFGFCPEVIAKASRLGIKIVEVPISYHPRTKAEGKKIRLWHGLEAFWCLVKYTWFDRSLEPGAPRKPAAALKEVVRPATVSATEAVPVK